MNSSMDIASYTNLPSKSKILALESTLKQSLLNFQDLVSEFVKLHIESENYKDHLLKAQEELKSKNCSNCEHLKSVLMTKDNVIQLVASTLTKLNETKNFNVLNEAFKILCGEMAIMTPPKDSEEQNISQSPKKEFESSIKENITPNDSISEIENTQTGRRSPIILSKKIKSTSTLCSTDFRDKKKLSSDWPSPENKMIKLTFPTPLKSKTNIKLKQARLNLIKVKKSNVVDITCSPEFCGGSRNQGLCKFEIKKETMDNEDTILPSPTSNPTNFSTVYRNAPKDSPNKFKNPLSGLKINNENINISGDSVKKELDNDITNIAELEESINILNPLISRFQASPKKLSLLKIEQREDADVTHCDIDSSMSLLQHVKKLDNDTQDVIVKRELCSPSKRPLMENINVTNAQTTCDNKSSMSLLRRDVVESVKRNKNYENKEVKEPIYKEPTVRKKSEKRALPGWSCDECKNFYDELYKNDPEMLEKKMNECSRHRGRNNPARPKTPPGFWNPRWDVPEDTEEFNRRNNAI